MNVINLHNYEEYYLDYIEGNLSAEHTAQLLLFLENNPNIKSELEDFEIIDIKAYQKTKIEKEPLKKYVDEQNIDHYIIASLEGQSDEYDNNELADYLSKTPEAIALSDRYKKTILTPSELEYPEKEELKKRVPVIYFWAPLTGVAAALLVFLMVYYSHTEQSNERISSIEPKTNLASDSSAYGEQIIVKEEVAIKDSPQKQVVLEVKTLPKDQNLKQQPIFAHDIRNHDDSMEIIVKDTTQDQNIELVLQPKQMNRKVVLNNFVANQDSIDIQKDSNSIETTLATAEPSVQKRKPSEVLSIGGWAKKMIRKKIFKQKKPTSDDITTDEIITAAANKIDENTGADMDYKKDDKRSSFGFTIGKFEFYRSKSR